MTKMEIIYRIILLLLLFYFANSFRCIADSFRISTKIKNQEFKKLKAKEKDECKRMKRERALEKKRARMEKKLAKARAENKLGRAE